MSKKITTLWIGNQTACICKTRFPYEFPEKGLIKVTEYPKKNIFGRKNSDLPVKGNLNNPFFIDMPLIDVRGKRTDETFRLILEDLYGDPSFNLAEKLGIAQKQNQVEELQVKLDINATLLSTLAKKVGILNIDELINKEVLRHLDTDKEMRKRLGISLDLHQLMRMGKK